MNALAGIEFLQYGNVGLITLKMSDDVVGKVFGI